MGGIRDDVPIPHPVVRILSTFLSYYGSSVELEDMFRERKTLESPLISLTARDFTLNKED